MRDYLVFDGINSKDYNIYIANKNQFDAPARDVKEYDIPGMNGSLTIDNGRFFNLKQDYLMYIRHDVTKYVPAFRGLLLKSSGYRKLQDSFNPDEFYYARFDGGFKIERSDRDGAEIKLSFDRKPQRYLVSGSKPVEVTTGSSLLNPTQYAAKPLIRAYGTGTLTVNGVSITITTANVYTDINCEIQDAYKGSTNCNGNITLTNGEFPTLSPGSNTITFSGLTKLEITPNWWTI